MKVAIAQPTYLPWIGYFNLIDQVDHFVFLDTVQFEKQSWQQRNQIRTPNGLEWLTLPVLHKGRFGQLIKDTEINTERYPEKQIRQIRMNYSRSPFLKKYEEEFFSLLETTAATKKISAVNEGIIRWACEKLGIETKITRSSDLEAPGGRSERLVAILKNLGADTYISPMGSLDYLKDEIHFFDGYSVFFINYEHPEYKQVYSPFMPYASVIDLLFNQGEKSLEILRSGNKPLIPAGELIAKAQS